MTEMLTDALLSMKGNVIDGDLIPLCLRKISQGEWTPEW